MNLRTKKAKLAARTVGALSARRPATILAAAALGTAALVIGAVPAEAAVVSRSDACGYACGSGTFTWSGNTHLSTGSMSVARRCGTGSGGSVIQIQVFEARNGLVYGAEHSNNLRCGQYKRFPSSGNTLSWSSSGGNICWWRVAVANTPSFSHVTYGSIQYNPAHPSGC
ncbi:hypothetical protein [Streptomyces sp. NPDC046985]|uniref:hypothetical protein n=1 Tax=Streptomyces sp. NPDC046985 TaxID=3155377 RepID=UPI0033C54E33